MFLFCRHRVICRGGEKHEKGVFWMKLFVFPQVFAVCRYAPGQAIQPPEKGMFFLARTENELSLVCESGQRPAGAKKVEEGWRALVVAGELDFSLVGVLAELSGVLAKAGVPIVALSTYDTDYLLVKEGQLEKALAALGQRGHEVEQSEKAPL